MDTELTLKVDKGRVRRVPRIPGCLLLSILIVSTSLWAAAPREIDLACELVDSAQRVEAVSYIKAFELYKQADSVLERILIRDPNSETVQNLEAGNLKIGDFTLRELRETIIPISRERAEAEDDPLDCLSLIALSLYPGRTKAQWLTHAIREYVKRDEFLRASQLFPIALNEALQVDDTLEMTYSLCELVNTGLARDHLQEFVALAESTESIYIRIILLTCLFSEYFRLGVSDSGDILLNQTLANLNDPSFVPRRHELDGLVIHELVTLGCYEKAVEVYDSTQGDIPLTFRECARASIFAAARDYDLVLSLASSCPDVQLFVALELAKSGAADSAKALISRFLARRLENRRLYGKFSAQDDDVRRFIEAKQFDLGFLLLETLGASCSKASILSELGRHYFEAGEVGRANAFFARALHLAFEAVDSLDRNCPLYSVAENLAAIGRCDSAFSLLQQNPDAYRYARDFAEIAYSCTQCGNLPLIEKFVETISNHLNSREWGIDLPDAWFNLASAYDAIGDHEKAHGMLDRAAAHMASDSITGEWWRRSKRIGWCYTYRNRSQPELLLQYLLRLTDAEEILFGLSDLSESNAILNASAIPTNIS